MPERRKSPYPTTADQLYEKDLRARTRTLLADRPLPAFDVVDAGELPRLLEHPQGHFDTRLRRNGLETALPSRPVDAGGRHHTGMTCFTAQLRHFP
ncbi:hypothetical protein ACFWJ5_08885 [Streptomyces qaidamensis]|uniref:hypothetical protein n=1 Tax=Streptomyces qaidamensis TaxID=1783515 RepID=UPI00365E57FF